jgi:hypothetical protein
MKLLANENLPLDVVEALRNTGYEVDWIRMRPLSVQARKSAS